MVEGGWGVRQEPEGGTEVDVIRTHYVGMNIKWDTVKIQNKNLKSLKHYFVSDYSKSHWKESHVTWFEAESSRRGARCSVTCRA